MIEPEHPALPDCPAVQTPPPGPGALRSPAPQRLRRRGAPDADGSLPRPGPACHQSMTRAQSNPIRPTPAAGFMASVLGVGQGIRPATVSITYFTRPAV